MLLIAHTQFVGLVYQVVHSLAGATVPIQSIGSSSVGSQLTVVAAGDVGTADVVAYSLPCSLVTADLNARVCISLSGSRQLGVGSSVVALMEECDGEYFVRYKPSPVAADGTADVSEDRFVRCWLRPDTCILVARNRWTLTVQGRR